MAGPTIEVRDATAGDGPEAVDLLRRQLEEHEITLAPAALAHAVRGLLEHPARGRILVAAAGDTLVGVAVLSFMWTLEHGGRAAWLDELYVDPRRRRLGIGRRLAEAAIERAAAAGCLALDLEVEAGREAAERLYMGAGFHPQPSSRPEPRSLPSGSSSYSSR